MSEESIQNPFLQQLKPLLGQVLAIFQEKEMIELEEGELEPLLVELLEAAEMAENPRKLLKSLVHTITHSEHVAEIYASDQELFSKIQDVLSGKDVS